MFFFSTICIAFTIEFSSSNAFFFLIKKSIQFFKCFIFIKTTSLRRNRSFDVNKLKYKYLKYRNKITTLSLLRLRNIKFKRLNFFKTYGKKCHSNVNNPSIFIPSFNIARYFNKKWKISCNAKRLRGTSWDCYFWSVFRNPCVISKQVYKVKFFWPTFHFSIIFLFLNLSYLFKRKTEHGTKWYKMCTN